MPSSPLRLESEQQGDIRAIQQPLAPGRVLAADRTRARVTLPERSTEPLRVEDATTGMAIGIQARNVFDVAAQAADGYSVYPHAHASGGTLLHRVLEDGVEDFVSFETRPAVPEVVYNLTLDKEVSGLRLVEGTLEMLDTDGAPRLRAAPPFIVGADGTRTDATLAVEGCAVDTNPAGPWGRDVTPPGAESCILRVRWPDEQVRYPAVLDPRWQTTGSMGVARQDHVAILLSTGKVLVAGGRSTTTTTTGLASAELFDRTTNTWSPTGGMTTGGRYQFTATQLGTNSNSNTSAHVLAAGGANAGSSLNTAQLYSVSAGTWAAVATNLPAIRSAHTATLLASGKVLLAGGVSVGGSATNTAVLYDPSTGTGTWTATGTMPQAVKGHTATLLAVPANATLNNKVVVVGGDSGSVSVNNVQLFDGTLNWSSLTGLSAAREGHTATALVNGNVLITGGKTVTTTTTTILNTTQLFNVASGSGSWSSAGTMVAARQLHTATLLPAGIVANGKVLLTGGNNSTGTLGTTELWDGTTTWAATTALPALVQAQTATLLSNNMVLIAGGTGSSGTVATAVIYDASFALACTSSSQCTTGFCVGGVCCDTVCNGGCGVCNLSGKVGTCSPMTSGAVCRASAGVCDVAETCNGTALTCPTDGFASSATVCRAAVGECDALEKCTGTSSACPADTKVASGTACTDDGNACTKDQCDGTNVTCQHPVGNAGTVCRAAAGTCDAAETCNGTSATCPSNAFLAAGTVCRAIAGPCDAAETCSGTSAACPADGFAASTTVCRASAGICDVAENCTGSSASCPANAFVSASTVCRPAVGQCDQPESCTGGSASCPADAQKSNGSTCSDGNACTTGDTCQSGACVGGGPLTCLAQDQCHQAGTCTSGACSNPPAPEGTPCNDGNSATAIDTCRSGTCVGTANPVAVLGFESLGQWSFTGGGTVLGLNNNHTEGGHSLEVTAQNYQPLVSSKLASIGTVGPVALLDILLPTQQANQGWFGSVQLYANAPSVGINNAFLGQAELTGLPLATWQTLAFQLTSAQVTALSGSYDDLTFTIGINVPYNETGHYLLDDLRFVQPITPHLLGIAKDNNGVLKAVFTYQLSGTTNVSIPYGPANALSDQNGFIVAPLEIPPTTFLPGSASHGFVATLVGPQLTWTVDGNSATATTASNQLPETTSGGVPAVSLPDGSVIPIDSPPSPALANAIVPSDTSYTGLDQATDQNLASAGKTPIGPTSAGTLPGNFRVTDDGAAEYVVPLDLPPGRNGIEPHLSLVYNSRAGMGVLGPGWSIRGLGQIARCRIPYGVANDRGQDPSAVTFTDSDDFCLDDQRLVSIAPNEYRFKRDDFTRILVTASDNDGPLTFQVSRKSGLIEYYGKFTNAIDNRPRLIGVDPSFDEPGTEHQTYGSGRRTWYLSEVDDRFGNAMRVNYALPTSLVPFGRTSQNQVMDELRSTPFPSSLAYTSNPNSGRLATKTVTFNYHAEPSLGIAKFESGVLTDGAGFILDSISATAPSPITPAVVTTYKMTYQGTTAPSITGRPQLQRIQRCDGAGVCMAPTVFTWTQGSYLFRHVASTVNDFFPASANYTSQALSDQSVLQRLIPTDLDGDGRDDIIYRSPLDPHETLANHAEKETATSLRFRLSNGNGFGEFQDAGIESVGVGINVLDQQLFLDDNVQTRPIPFDIDGDGQSELIVPYTQGNTGGLLPIVRFDMFTRFSTGFFTQLPSGPETFEEDFGDLILADVNGDGLIDFGRKLNPATNGSAAGIPMNLGIRMNQNGILAPDYLVGPTWDGGSFQGQQVPGFADVLFTADVDGDGRTEVVMTTPAQQIIGVHGGTTGLTTMPVTGVPPFGDVYFKLDANGDGLVDIVGVQPNGTGGGASGLWINTGNGFLPTYSQTLADPVTDNFMLNTGTVMDINHDGMDDVVVPGCIFQTNQSPVAFISDGMGGYTFTPLTNIPPALVLTDRTGFRHCLGKWMDVDGDGQKDLVQPEAGTDFLQIYFRQDPAPDRIVQVQNGIGSPTSINYTHLTNAGGCSYPNACRNRNLEVVSDYSVGNGQVVAGQATSTHYTMNYLDPRVDALGEGLLGFDAISRVNDVTKVSETKEYNLTTHIGNWHPFVGLPTAETTFVTLSGSGRQMVRSRKTTLQTIQSDPSNVVGAYSIQTQSIDEREEEAAPGGSIDSNHPQRWTIQNMTYDGFGNVTNRETLGKIAGTRDVVQYGVSNDTTNWLLGQVNSITETSTSAVNETDSRVTTFVTDPATGVVTSSTIEPNNFPLQLITVYTRNTDGLVTKTTQTPAAGDVRTTQATYDAVEGAWPASYTNSLGQVRRLVYDCNLGILASSTDPNNVTTQMQYDGFGRLRNVSDDTGMASSLHYLRPASNLGTTIPWSKSTVESGTSVYDSLGRDISDTTTTFNGTGQRTINRSYNAFSGRPGSVTRPFGATGGGASSSWAFEYDEIGRLVLVQPPGEFDRTTTYTGLQTTEFVAGIEKGYRIDDGMGRIVLSTAIEPTSTAPNQEIRTGMDYGPFGTLRHVVEPSGGTKTLSYDHLGHRTELDDPDKGTQINGYNSFGELVFQSLAGQGDLAYGRDDLGRVTSIEQGLSTTTYQWDTAANGVGKLDRESNPFGVATSYGYQANGLLQSTAWLVDGTQFTMGWAYNASGQLQQITYPAVGTATPLTATLSYGQDGRVDKVSTPTVDSVWQKIGVADDGQTSLEGFGDGTGATHDFEPMTGRLRHIATGTGAVLTNGDGHHFANDLQLLRYVHYSDGKLERRFDDELVTAEQFSYDNVDRVTNWQSLSGDMNVTYGYDDSGNLRSRQQTGPSNNTATETYGYGENGAGPHAVTSGPAGTYGYDPSGRQISRPGQPTVNYTFFDLPQEIVNSSGSAVTFAYDAEGTRIVKSSPTNEVITLGGLYERRIDNGVTTHVFYLPGDGATVAQIVCTADGTCAAPAMFHPDDLGTIDTVTSNGIVIGRQKRDPFGRSYTSQNISVPNEPMTLGFIGQTEDQDIGLVNLNHRLYDPQTGRFISPDPLISNPFNGQGYNPYTYVLNNPLSFVDPTGLSEEDDTGADLDDASALATSTPIASEDLGSAQGWIDLGTKTSTDQFGNVTTVQTLFNPNLAPAGWAFAFSGAFSGLDSTTTQTFLPSFGSLASSSQNFINGSPTASDAANAQARSLYAAGGPNGGPTNADVRSATPRQGVYRDWLTGAPGKVSIPIIPMGDVYLYGVQAMRNIVDFFRGNPAAAGPAVILAQRLTEAAESPGPVTQLYSKLTQLPEVGQKLYTATEAELAEAARPVGQLFGAQIPTKLLIELEAQGMVFRGTLEMNGVIGSEIQFTAKGSEYVAKYFSEIY